MPIKKEKKKNEKKKEPKKKRKKKKRKKIPEGYPTFGWMYYELIATPIGVLILASQVRPYNTEENQTPFRITKFLLSNS